MEEQTQRSTTTPGASGQGIYLYCFARPGLPPGVAGGSLENHEPVTFVEVGDVVAVCCRVTLDDFTGESGESHFQDPTWVVPRACRHERVIEEVMKFSPVFPVRFGAVFSSREALAQAIVGRGTEISSFLDRVVGKEEWSVKGFVDIDKAADRLLETDPALAEQCRNLPELPGARYFQQKRLRTEARKQAKHSCRSTAERADQELAGLGESMSSGLKLGDAPDDKREVVLKRAFLLSRESVAEFRDRVMEIGSMVKEEAPSSLTLELSGPWPPYSFCPTPGKSKQ